MEFLGGLVFQVLWWFVELLGELLLQLAFATVTEILGHAFGAPWRAPRPMPPWLAIVGYLLFGAAAGGVTVWLVPELFIRTEWLRLANLLLTPLAAGLLMQAVGRWRERRGMEVTGLAGFAFGFCYAFAMALVRLVFGA